MEPTIGKIDWAVFRDTTQELLDQTIYQPFAKKSTAAPIIVREEHSEPNQDLKELCRPVVEYIQKKYGSPHHRIIIDWCSATVVQDLCGVPFQVPD